MAVSPYSKNKSADWITVSIYFSLVVIGWFMVFSTLYDPKNEWSVLDITTPLGAQSMWVVLSIIIFLVALTLEWKFWNTLAFPIYGVTLLALILVLFIGKEINGAKAWFSFGFFSIQPSEWSKFGTALALSSYMSFFKASYQSGRIYLNALALFIGPALLILLQPDFGSALIFTSFFILLYRRGLSPSLPLTGIGISAVFILSLLFSPLMVLIFSIYIGGTILAAEVEKGNRLVVYAAVVLLIMIFMLLQKESASLMVPALLYFSYFFYRVLMRKNIKLIVTVSSIVAASAIFGFGSSFLFENVLKPHQQERINVWLRPEKCDPRGSLYNIIQSKLAIGSGGLTGKGFLKGEMTKLDYVPEQSTDFIFTSIGEEQGFLGSMLVIILFAILIIRCVTIAERANLEFIRNYGYAVAGILLFHVTFNIGMTMGLLPVVGIPLPFISKGGSSLAAFSLMIAVLIKMDLARFRAN
jgi:rod shape determining protein RodA